MLHPARDAGHDRRVHRGRGGRTGRALDDRERHAVSADAVRARGAPRQAGRDGPAWPTPARRRPASAPSRRSGRSRRRSSTWSSRCRTRRCIPPEDPSYHPTRDQRERCSSTPSIAPSPRRSSSTWRPPTRRCGSPSCGCSAARWPASRPTRRRSPTGRAGSWSTSRRSTRVPTTSPGARSWVDDFVDALDQGDDGAYVNFLGDEGEARVRAAYPGATWDRLAEIKRRYDPTNLFRLNQNVPPASGEATEVAR